MEKHRLLIIDDAENLSLLYKEELQEEGYEADVANSIPDANVLLGRQSYDLMIIGTRLNRKFDHAGIRSGLNVNKNEIPVILVGTPQSKPETETFSFSAFIEKSSDTAPLKEKVNEMINKFYYDGTEPGEFPINPVFFLAGHPVYAQIGSGSQTVGNKG